MLSLLRSLAVRPLAGLALGLMLGVALGRGQAGLPVFPLAITSAFAATAALALLWRLRPGQASALFAAAGLCLGLARVQPLAQALTAPDLPDRSGRHLQARLLEDLGPRPETGRHAFTAEVLSLEPIRRSGRAHNDSPPPWRSQGGGGAARASSARAEEGAERAPTRLRFTCTLEPAALLGPGDQIEAWGNLRGLHPPTNPGEFDYRSYALGQGLKASFSARQGWPVRRLRQGSSWHPRRAAWTLRRWLQQGLQRALGPRSAALASGLALGDRSGLKREDQADFARAGLADILAVSGAHFAIVLGLAMLVIGRFTWRRRRQAALGLALGAAYALATGFEPPVQRAFVLFALVLAGRILDLEADWGSSLAAAVVLILLSSPGALFEPGFQLSLAAAWAVLAPGAHLAAFLPEVWPAWLRRGLGSFAAAQWLVVGLLAWHFHCFQWVGLATPLLSAPAAPLLLGGALLLAPLAHGPAWLWGWLAGAVERSYQAFDSFGAWASQLPQSAFSTGTPSVWLMAAWLALPLGLLAARRAWILAGLGLAAAVLCTALLWPGLPWAHRHPGLTKAWLLDVGQGDAFLAEFPDGRSLLVDAGASKPDMGAWVVGPALRALGIQGLDWAVATHPHADHVGGYFWLMDQFPVAQLCHSGQRSRRGAWGALLHRAAEHQVPLRDLYVEGPPADWAGRLRLLSPLSPLARSKRRVHDRGVVLELEGWLLLPGDMEAGGEAHLLEQGLLRPVQVVKVGHHGSRSSSSQAFLKALRPADALVSCGRGNLYGHPNALALQRLSVQRLWRTDLQGCLSITKKAGERASIQPWRPASGPLRQAPRRRRFRWKGLPIPAPELRGQGDSATMAAPSLIEEP